MRTDSAHGVVCEACRARRVHAFVFEYDGTLVERHPRLDKATLDSEARDYLIRFGRWAKVAVMTSRSVRNVREVAGELPGVTLATNDGLLIVDDRVEWPSPSASSIATELESIREELGDGALAIPGAWIESKVYSLMLHTRQGGTETAEMLKAARAVVSAHHGDRFRPVETSGGLEVQPDRAWDRGRGVADLLSRWGIERCLYVGSSDVDEPAFEAVKACGGVTCRVADKVEQTAAEWTLSGPRFRDLLEQLLLNWE